MRIQGKVKAVSGPREFQGVTQIGFVLEEQPKTWYNISGKTEELEQLKKNLILKGAEVSFEYDPKTKKVEDLKQETAPEKKEDWTEEMTTFEDLLSDAHEKFGEKMHIRTELVKDGNEKLVLNFEKKRALVKAQVYIRRDDKNTQVFEAHGDTTEENVKGDVGKHFIRLAETRAIARALRWATNNASVAKEETDEGELPEQGGKK